MKPDKEPEQKSGSGTIETSERFPEKRQDVSSGADIHFTAGGVDIFKCYPRPEDSRALKLHSLWRSVQRSNAALQVILDSREGDGNTWLDFNSETAMVLRRDLKDTVRLLRERYPAGVFDSCLGDIESRSRLIGQLNRISSWLEFPGLDDFPGKDARAAQAILMSFPGTPCLQGGSAPKGDSLDADSWRAVRLSKSLLLYLGLRGNASEPGFVDEYGYGEDGRTRDTRLGSYPLEQIRDQLENTISELEYIEVDFDNPRWVKRALASVNAARRELASEKCLRYSTGIEAALDLAAVEAGFGRRER